MSDMYLAPEQTHCILGWLKTYIPTVPGIPADIWLRDLKELEHLWQEAFQFPYRGFSFSFHWHRSFRVDCTLTVQVHSVQLHYPLTEGNGQTSEEIVRTFAGHVSLNWSGTERSPTEARAAVALYAAVTDLACQLEATLTELISRYSKKTNEE